MSGNLNSKELFIDTAPGPFISLMGRGMVSGQSKMLTQCEFGGRSVV